MTYSFIAEHAAETLFSYVLGQEMDVGGGEFPTVSFLHCRFFQINLKLDEESIRSCFGEVLQGNDARVYSMDDGDIVVQYDAAKAGLYGELKEIILDKYRKDIKRFVSLDEFFHDYDLFSTRSALKVMCLKKQKKATKKVQALSSYLENKRLVRTLKNTIQMISMQRSFRANPHILIVEDQAFSQKMLLAALDGYECYIAESTAEALVQYVEKCPDIVLLDVDLPDISGHRFANFVKKIDPDSYIVMISANRYESDIRAAQDNNVQGYIAKPFNQEDIAGIFKGFSKYKKKRVM